MIYVTSGLGFTGEAKRNHVKVFSYTGSVHRECLKLQRFSTQEVSKVTKVQYTGSV